MRKAFEEDEQLDDHYSIDRLDLIECDMVQDPECYYKAIKDVKPDYVIHTAAPFMLDVSANDSEVVKTINERTSKYHLATQLLARGACRENVRKVVMTGAATSVIGDKPRLDGTYHDSNEWATIKEVVRPNEKAKILAEKVCWDEILKH